LGEVTITELIGREPKALEVIEVEASQAPAGLDETAVSRLARGRVPQEWLVAGPVSEADDDAAAWRAAFEAQALPTAGARVEAGGAEATLRRLGPEARTKDGHVDALAAAGGKSGTVTYYFTLLESNRRQDLVYRPQGVATEAWLAGRPLEKETVVRFGIGFYPLVVRCGLGRQPPFVRSVPMAPRFYPQQAAEMTPAEWRERIALFKDRLERVVEAGEKTEWAPRARLLLDEVTGGK
jgi:hypothetical protein